MPDKDMGGGNYNSGYGTAAKSNTTTNYNSSSSKTTSSTGDRGPLGPSGLKSVTGSSGPNVSGYGGNTTSVNKGTSAAGKNNSNTGSVKVGNTNVKTNSSGESLAKGGNLGGQKASSPTGARGPLGPGGEPSSSKQISPKTGAGAVKSSRDPGVAGVPGGIKARSVAPSAPKTPVSAPGKASLPAGVRVPSQPSLTTSQLASVVDPRRKQSPYAPNRNAMADPGVPGVPGGMPARNTSTAINVVMPGGIARSPSRADAVYGPDGFKTLPATTDRSQLESLSSRLPSAPLSPANPINPLRSGVPLYDRTAGLPPSNNVTTPGAARPLGPSAAYNPLASIRPTTQTPAPGKTDRQDTLATTTVPAADPRRRQSGFANPTTPIQSRVQMQQVGTPAQRALAEEALRRRNVGPTNTVGNIVAGTNTMPTPVGPAGPGQQISDLTGVGAIDAVRPGFPTLQGPAPAKIVGRVPQGPQVASYDPLTSVRSTSVLDSMAAPEDAARAPGKGDVQGPGALTGQRGLPGLQPASLQVTGPGKADRMTGPRGVAGLQPSDLVQGAPNKTDRQPAPRGLPGLQPSELTRAAPGKIDREPAPRGLAGLRPADVYNTYNNPPVYTPSAPRGLAGAQPRDIYNAYNNDPTYDPTGGVPYMSGAPMERGLPGLRPDQLAAAPQTVAPGKTDQETPAVRGLAGLQPSEIYAGYTNPAIYDPTGGLAYDAAVPERGLAGLQPDDLVGAPAQTRGLAVDAEPDILNSQNIGDPALQPLPEAPQMFARTPAGRYGDFGDITGATAPEQFAAVTNGVPEGTAPDDMMTVQQGVTGGATLDDAVDAEMGGTAPDDGIGGYDTGNLFNANTPEQYGETSIAGGSGGVTMGDGGDSGTLGGGEILGDGLDGGGLPTGGEPAPGGGGGGGGTPTPEGPAPIPGLDQIMPWDVSTYMQLRDIYKLSNVDYTPAMFQDEYYDTRRLANASVELPDSVNEVMAAYQDYVAENPPVPTVDPADELIAA